MFAEQALADRRDGHGRNIEVDKGRRRIVGFGMIGALLVARALEGGGDVADGEAQAPHRAFLDEAGPVRRGGMRGIEFPGHHLLRKGAGHFLGLGNLPRGANHAFGNDRHGHGRPADDIHRGAAGRGGLARGQNRAPDIAADEIRDARRRNADQHDRLVMRHQARAGNLAVRRQAFEDLDRLARIAGRVHPISIDERIAEQFIGGKDFDDFRLALDGPVMIGAGRQFSRGNLRQIVRQMAFRRERRTSDKRPTKQGQYSDQLFYPEPHIAPRSSGTIGARMTPFRAGYARSRLFRTKKTRECLRPNARGRDHNYLNVAR